MKKRDLFPGAVLERGVERFLILGINEGRVTYLVNGKRRNIKLSWFIDKPGWKRRTDLETRIATNPVNKPD